MNESESKKDEVMKMFHRKSKEEKEFTKYLKTNIDAEIMELYDDYEQMVSMAKELGYNISNADDRSEIVSRYSALNPGSSRDCLEKILVPGAIEWVKMHKIFR